MSELLLNNKLDGKYNGITENHLLAFRINEDLQREYNDEHLSVRCGPGSQKDSWWSSLFKPDDDVTEEDIKNNFWFKKTEVMADNIGYIRFDEFHHSKRAMETASKELEKVEECSALIIDLRTNYGGGPEMIQYFSSYFFKEGTLIFSRDSRIHRKNVKEWQALNEIPGKPFDENLPIYILTSSYTASAAESFIIAFKDYKRAVIVGETTRGSTHPSMVWPVNDKFNIQIPYAYSLSPVTKTDLEGVGIIPDINVSADEALDAAINDVVKKIKD